jgi:hypothetical protein
MLEFIQENWSIMALVIVIIIAIAFMIPMAVYISKYNSMKKKCSPYEENLDDVTKFLENKKMFLDAVAGQKECANYKSGLEQCSKDKSECIATQEAAMKERDQSKQELETCMSGKAQCEKEKNSIMSNINNSSSAVATCLKEKEQINAAKLAATNQLTQCNKDKQKCATDKATAIATAAKNKADLDTCNVARTTVQANLTKCTTGLNTCNTNLTTCNSNVKECQTKLATLPVPAPSNLVYKKINKAYGTSGLCADVAGASQDSGVQLVGWNCHGGANQLFGYDAASKLLFAKHSGKCLSSKDKKITQEDCVKTPEKQWEMIEANGIYQIVNKATATPLYMNYEGALAPGVKMVATPTSQSFKFI